MKKSTVKSNKPAATVKAVAPAVTVKKATTKIVKKPAAASAKVPSAAAAKPVAASKTAKTVITASVDVGFGNTLFIRGEGAGLSWEAGVAMECVSDATWSITLPASAKPVVYKFLVNDQVWSAGDDYVAKPGSGDVIAPSF